MAKTQAEQLLESVGTLLQLFTVNALVAAPTTVLSSLYRMIRNGLIERKPHAVSKRAKAHFLTIEGQSVRAAIHRQYISNMEAMLSVLTVDERIAVSETLVNVVAKLNQSAPA